MIPCAITARTKQGVYTYTGLFHKTVEAKSDAYRRFGFPAVIAVTAIHRKSMRNNTHPSPPRAA
ncbi:hypothetical protein [Xylella fastidiosa]|uniref:hypothetical protein n=1 Tax=Xylella fastidiosa TaxID=2371 RepID=UPI00021442FA|nr:hypothetical protein [Xylella fastidiosa]EGO82405.1 hypothetical protein XFEB_00737 [Xylella fastidiosa EB92.1]MDD0930329.1 hypothetical protein [Xylella fastidiosa subsp. multiplex]MDD0943628.1 hypothetical protein [Xylella fastidiosa subsp. multiplex]MRT33455.1 hypothetical protein [Xylella fastidiosa subsp. multiplex]MRT45114.1 hypothetical protein [Xylella fastidiosa subsp. multiplex]